jgi:pimeloyl-ACP methyl ester carboxylesterase
VLLTSGVLGGGTRAYDFRLDLRVIYQHLCGDHPRADEPAYPLWMGLPVGSPLTRAQLDARARECLGLGRPAAQRTPEQARRLAAVTGILRIPESSVIGHLNWATFHFQDLAQRYGQRPVFGNRGVVYRGSGDAALDAAIDAGVVRYTADPEAVRAFAADADPSGRIGVPVLSVHALHDPTAFVELQHRWREQMRQAGSAERLVQVYTEHAEHSYLADAVYVAALQQLLAWVEQGRKPAPADVAAACRAAEPTWGPGCRMLEGFEPLPLERRVAARLRP